MPSRTVSTPPAPPVAPDDGEDLLLSLLDVVYGQAWIGAGASPIVGAVLCSALWKAADHSRLLSWLGALLAVMVLRYGVVIAFRRFRGRWRAATWAWVFAGSLTLASLVWGLGALYIVPADSAFHQALVFSFLIGMAGGSALIYTAHQAGALASLYSIALPMTVALLFQTGLTLRLMALGGVLLMLIGTTAILRLGGFIRRSFELSRDLEKARRTAEVQAQTDDLTGLYNRRAFYEMGEYLIAQAARLGYPLSLLLLDVDNFKRINDRHGHAAGDAVLRTLASTTEACFRKIDVVGRLGGDEFGVLLPEAPLEAAIASADRLRQRLRESLALQEGLPGPVTCSAGTASHRPGESLDELIARADAALYRSKQEGRDRVTG